MGFGECSRTNRKVHFIHKENENSLMYSVAVSFSRLSFPVQRLTRGNQAGLLGLLDVGGIGIGIGSFGFCGHCERLHAPNLHAIESVAVASKRMFVTSLKPTGNDIEGKVPSVSVLPIPSKEDVHSLFKLWNNALASMDSRLVVRRFSKNAVILPTISDEPRMDAESIRAYFDDFLKLKPLCEILQSKVHVGPGWAQDVGIYEIRLGSTNKKSKARYSFTYIYEDEEWKILHQHSSQMPEEVMPIDAPKLTAEEVRNLFHLWNDALDTLDPEAVANRFTRTAVLLPTVSDIPRTTPEAIKDYFTLFLKSKPQGKILQSYVQFGPKWAKDVGTYEFTLRGDNNKIVRARYTFIYRFEDGQWKISHQHSSQMPEGLMAAEAAMGETMKKADK